MSVRASEVSTLPTPAVVAPPARLTSLDAFRGATMLFMASEILHLPRVARQFASSRTAQALGGMLDHRAWVGCAPWDLIQPAFMFMVGVALPFSLASRRARGQTFGPMLLHAVVRAGVLIALGIVLRSQSRSQTYFTFEDVLTQIGLGYVLLFLLAWTRPRVQAAAAAVLLVGYWAAFAMYPLPPASFDTTAVGVPVDWPHQLDGFAAHWNKNTNAAHAFDQWFLNLFPRERPFVYNGGGYLTLNFVPSLATMIFGLLAGGLLRSGRTAPSTLKHLVAWALIGIGLGALLHVAGVCPIVKRIWTPSWTLFSAGWVLLMLAAFHYIVDLKGYRRWTFPLVVVGMNSIAMYVLVHIATDYVTRTFLIHAGRQPFEIFGPVFAPVVLGASTLAVFWAILAWMYRHRLFVKV